MSDNLVSDMLSAIKNASLSGHKHTKVRWSKLNEAVLKALLRDGYVSDYTLIEEDSLRKKSKIVKIEVKLKYDGRGCPVIRYMRSISKPSVRIYQGKNEYKTKEQYSTLIVTTNKGVMSHIDARNLGLGGEVICEVGC